MNNATNNAAVNTRSELRNAAGWLASEVLEREQVIDYALASVLSGDHIFLLGPPGIGKTYLVRKVAGLFGVKTFNALISPQTREQDLFGPPDLQALIDGEQRRKYQNFLPGADLAILDEIWKADGTNLNPLLDILQEDRQFVDNGVALRAPLRSAFLCSNETPGDASLAPLYDRCLWRFDLGYLRNPDNFDAMIFGTSPSKRAAKAPTPKLDLTATLADYGQFQIVFSKEDRRKFQRFIAHLRRVGIVVSDRRAKAMIPAVKALAYVRGCDTLPADWLAWLAPAVWDTPEQIPLVDQVLIDGGFIGRAGSELRAIRASLSRVHTLIDEGGNRESVNSELREIQRQIDALDLEDHDAAEIDREITAATLRAMQECPR